MNTASPLPRLAIVLSHPTQYYSPWFRWLRTHTELPFRVFYLWDFGVTAQRDPQFQTSFRWDVDLLSGYDSEFVPNRARDPGTHHFRGLQNPELPTRLAAWRPDAVLLFGYNWLTPLRLIAWARLRRIPLLFRGDSHFLGRGAPRGLRRLALRAIYAQFRACLHVGSANRDYFTAIGVPPSRCVFAPHSVNHELFDRGNAEHRAAAGRLRGELSIASENRVVLFAGKFTPAKQPVELLRAFLALARPATTLVFVGDGPAKEALHALARTAPDGSVRFLPFANQSEMPARLLLADLFVLPSRGVYETWGLAVNEAMHMGVPALVSDLVGCQRDLVTDGKTGWVYSATKPDDLRAKLAVALETLDQPQLRAQIHAAVAARIAGYTYKQTSAGLLAALALSARA